MGELLPPNKSAGYFREKCMSIILCSGFQNEAMNIEKLNRTRIHLILFSPLSVSVSIRIGVAETHFVRRSSSMQIALQNYFVVLVVLYCACEGSKQRFVPTGLATGDNEIEQHRNFSETHFLGVAPCRFRLDGHDGNAVWDEAVPMYVTRLGDLIEKSAQRNLF